MSETEDRYQQMMNDCRDGDSTDFTALVKLMQNLKYGYHQNKDQATQAAKSEGNWTDRDIGHAADMVYDMGM